MCGRVIDRAGVVRYAKADAFDLDTLNVVLIPLLKEPAPPDPAPAPPVPAATSPTTTASASPAGAAALR